MEKAVEEFPADVYSVSSEGFNGTFAPTDSQIFTRGTTQCKKDRNIETLCMSNSGKKLGHSENQIKKNSQVYGDQLDSFISNDQSRLPFCNNQRDSHPNSNQNNICESDDETHLHKTSSEVSSCGTESTDNKQNDLFVENNHDSDLPVDNEMVQKYLNQEELDSVNVTSPDQDKSDFGNLIGKNNVCENTDKTKSKSFVESSSCVSVSKINETMEDRLCEITNDSNRNLDKPMDAETDSDNSTMEKKLCGATSNAKTFKCNYEFSNQISPCSEALKLQQDLDPAKYGPNGNLDNRCEVCGKTFSQPYLLKVHFRIHTGYKPYRCKLCDKGFAQSSGLRSHMLTHTGEKPYKCDICDKTFTASGSLTMHYRTHNGERPFPCEVCGRKFRYRSAMTKHMMIHTGDRPYTCSDCGKDFSRKGNLETHRRIHTNATPYQCDVCEKKFNQMSNLKTHQLIHTTVKPYKCDLCGSEFCTKFNMQRHIVIQHIKNKR